MGNRGSGERHPAKLNSDTSSLEKFDGEIGGVGTHTDHGHEVVGAHADDGDVAGTLVDGKEKIFLRIEAQR